MKQKTRNRTFLSWLKFKETTDCLKFQLRFLKLIIGSVVFHEKLCS